MLLFSGISHPGYFVPLGVSLSDQSASFWNTTKRIANGAWGSSGNHKAFNS